MKKLASCLLVMTLGGVGAQGTVLLMENFDTDGVLNTYPNWATQIPGVSNDPVAVAGGVATVSHNPGFPFGDAEDVQNQSIGVQTAITYAGFDLTIDTPATLVAGGPASRFFHIETVSDVAVGRTFLTTPGAGGDYSLRISNNNLASAQSSDLTFGQTYRIVVGYDDASGLSSLWIDPLNMGSTSFVSPVADTSSDAVGIEFQQRGEQTADMMIDRLVVATTFNEASLVPEPGTLALILLGSVAVFARRRQFKVR